MKEQLDQLENSVLQLLTAYADAKKELETLREELARKDAEIAQLKADSSAVEDRISKLVAGLESELPRA
ncbi:hypothetical protein [Duodenibacillus massiliensis]|uniref:hypothetical protein n=1 Tax=Duodenibacillus massiliensis TaxID=1852381 RepID=UPI0025905125|nr:hypothetical protein [uncultured Duodenibacillus sp.]MBS1385645.1 hypothetical protein [Duodenibacillus sp.]